MLVKQKCDITGKRSWHGKRKYVDRQVEEKTDPGIKEKKAKKKIGQVKTKVPRGGRERNTTFPAYPDQPLICTVTGRKRGEAIVT
jgi:hypothetical protein